jgi:hypothetical protein
LQSATASLWSYLAPAGSDVDLAAPPGATAGVPGHPKVIVINRPLAKTITYHTIGTVIDFTTNYAAISDAATAVALTAFRVCGGSLRLSRP